VQILAPCADLTIGHTGNGFCICTEQDPNQEYGLAVKAECPVSGHTATVYAVALSPDGKSIVSGSEDTFVKIWDVETGSEVSSFAGVRRGYWGDLGNFLN
jgi:WD40 repeat protein